MPLMSVRDIDFAALGDLRGRYGAMYPRGRIVFREGDTGTELFVVLQGAVDMTTRDAWSGEPRLVRTLVPGEFFGEMSCFCDRPRAATAVVREDAVLLCLNQVAITELLARSPRFARGVIQTLCDRIQADTHDVARARTLLSDPDR
jgi:CRP/FNR family cyclic AMP-dependent transcriptional regulator